MYSSKKMKNEKIKSYLLNEKDKYEKVFEEKN
jgi:hypothetical protein